MPQFSGTKQYFDGEASDESQLDALKSSIETFFNTTKLDEDNIQSLGVSAANVNALAVTTAKIATGAVTRPKLVALGQQVSDSCSNFTTTNNTYTDVTNLSVSITTTGRPVIVMLVSDGSAGVAGVGCFITGTQAEARFKVLRDATVVGLSRMVTAAATATDIALAVPTSCIFVFDVVTAGTYTYKVQTRVASGDTALVLYSKLVAFEV